MQEKQQHGPGVRAGVCGAGTKGASGAGGLQSSTRLQNTHEHRLLQPPAVLLALWVPPKPGAGGQCLSTTGMLSKHQGHTLLPQSSLHLSAYPSFLLLLLPSACSCRAHPAPAPKLLPTPGHRTKRTAPASPWHPRGHQAGTGLQGARADVTGIQDLSGFSPCPPIRHFSSFLQSLGGQEECLII